MVISGYGRGGLVHGKSALHDGLFYMKVLDKIRRIAQALLMLVMV
jgi:hypothetical protein